MAAGVPIVQVARDLDAVVPAVLPQRRDGGEADGVAVEPRGPPHEVVQPPRMVFRQRIRCAELPPA